MQFKLVYPVPTDDDARIREHVKKFGYPFEWVRDTRQQLVKQTGASVTPEVAVLDASGTIVYRGRIDDNWKEPERVARQDLRQQVVDRHGDRRGAASGIVARTPSCGSSATAASTCRRSDTGGCTGGTDSAIPSSTSPIERS